MDLNKEQLLNSIQELEELLKHGQNVCSKAKNLCHKINYISKSSDNNDASQKLLDYRIMLEDNNFWQSRYEYLKIIEMFLDEKINGKEFANQFETLWCKDLEIREWQESHLKTKTDFQLTSKSIYFSKIIGDLSILIEICESQSSISEISENKLKNLIKEEILPKIRTYCEETIK